MHPSYQDGVKHKSGLATLATTDQLTALQDEAAKLKHPTVKGFLKSVRKLQLANKPVHAETMAATSS